MNLDTLIGSPRVIFYASIYYTTIHWQYLIFLSFTTMLLELQQTNEYENNKYEQKDLKSGSGKPPQI